MERKEQSSWAGEMLFGIDRATDERSLALFLQRMTDPGMAATLFPRLAETEIHAILDLFTALMKKHLHEDEYHRIFLGEEQE